MPLTTYYFSQAVGAFFEMPTSDARKILPPHLPPLEVRHGSSILALTAFDFTDSMVGPYQEVVLSVIVPPRVEPGREHAKSAFYPFILGTSTRESREHAIERWHLPHFMQNVVVQMSESDGGVSVAVRDGDRPILDFSVTEYHWEPVRHLYQSYMVDDGKRLKVNIHMEGTHSEHEEESGELRLYEHEMTRHLTVEEVGTVPFREQWMKNGVQTFEDLETL
jgi:hypothetical protein